MNLNLYGSYNRLSLQFAVWARLGSMTQPPADDDHDTPSPDRRILLAFGLAGGGIVVIGVIVILALTLTSGIPGGNPTPEEGPQEDLPPLAQACPPPTTQPQEPEPAPPAEGARITDADSGISYAELDEPWIPWTQEWTHGDLEVAYRSGQYFVTEEYAGGEYLASILSGSVPAAVNDGMELDLECISQQVLADVRVSYYPQPNEMETVRDEAAVLGGRPAWIQEFKLEFERDGLEAVDEQVAVALIDVGRIEASVLYLSIPGTHDEYNSVISEVMESVRPVDDVE